MEKQILSAVLKEMADNIDVGVDKNIVSELIKDDKAPMFVTVEAANPQVSANGNVWDKKALFSIAEQVNTKKPDGYFGHLTEEERETKMPESQTLWLGATVKEIDGKDRLFIKGYVLPYANKLRTYLKKAIAIGKKVGVSVYGTANQIWDNSLNAKKIMNFDLESIDWARPGAEGMKTMGLVSVTSEMKEGKVDNDKLLKELAEARKTTKEMYNEYIKNRIKNLVDNEAVGKFLIRLTISEMKGKEINKPNIDNAIDSVIDSDEGKTLIKEMCSRSSTISPATNNKINKKVRKYTTV